ncbi:aldo/keto reductase [uncultured Friedmanniella sp.]|uniref:aldo/keto reductase n=1 Tax=uncultured Friedmanniella sp. TaxID=335381 RepID=UPI0035CC3EC8
MTYRTRARTGTSVSNLALGAMELGAKSKEDDSFAVLDLFVEAGGNLIDTANGYGGGESEELLGRCSPAARPRSPTASCSPPRPASALAPTPTRPAPDAETSTSTRCTAGTR